MEIAAGTRLGRYEIRSRIGAGGMGEVYLAQDVELHRAVAIKVLSAELTSDRQQTNRFLQEARAASALNHPNILTIYETGQTDAGCFIATEFIDGQTLREHIRSGQMEMGELLDAAIQVASALSAAHAVGIVHRDIKPENIMLRRDGYAKVLDFGLAKLTQRHADDPEALTIHQVKTEPGIVMGTVSYMSPEQARGFEVDARTDVWSLGVVIYEMVTGRTPFAGPTSSDTLSLILQRDPLPLARHSLRAPAELDRIVLKALDKDREDRYQTIREMLIDLRRLKKRLDFEAELERSVPPDSRSGGAVAEVVSDGHAITEIMREPAAPSGDVEAGRATSNDSPAKTTSAEGSVKPIARHKQGALIGVGLLLLALAGVGFALYKFSGRHRSAAVPFQNKKITRLTTSGKAADAAISPDGKYVAYVLSDAGKQSVRVRQVATTQEGVIVAPAEVQYEGLSFSPGGDYIFYTATGGDDGQGALYQVSVLGGAPRKLLIGIDSPVSFSPDGKRLAYLRALSGEEVALKIASADGTGGQTLATRRKPDFFKFGPAWSPDGERIACAAGSYSDGFYMNVVGVQVKGGEEKPLTPKRWWSVIGRVAWLPDDGGLIIAAREHPSVSSVQLWHVSPDGEARAFTEELNDYSGVTLASASNSLALVTVQSDQTSDIWIAPDADADRAKQVTSGKSDGVSGVSWTPDGKLVFASSDASGSRDIWSVGADGSNRKQLTINSGSNLNPSVSPDGRYIVFGSNRAGTFNIWRMDIDGGNPLRLTSGSGEWWPSCSPDGHWVVYTAFGLEGSTLWRVPVEGGGAVQLSEKRLTRSSISPDGKWIACFYRNDPAVSTLKIAVLPSEGGAPVKVFAIAPTVNTNFSARWTADGRALTYVDTPDDASEIWSQPLDGGSPKLLTKFKSQRIFYFDWSRDGKNLAYARGAETANVVFIQQASE